MSQVKRARDWIPEAPSSAAAHGAIAALNHQEIPGLGNAPTGGAGPIERRMANEAQREQWREEAAQNRADALQLESKPIHLVRPAALRQAQRNGQAVRQQQRAAAAFPAKHARPDVPLITLAPDPVTEEPAMPEPSSTPEPEEDEGFADPDMLVVADAARALADAATEAAEALGLVKVAEENYESARRALLAAWAAVGIDEAMPPDHLPAQSIELADGTLMRAHSDGKPETIAALKELGEAAVAQLGAERARTSPPKPKPAAGGGPGPRPPFVARMLDALVEADGDYTATAKALGIARTSVVGTMSKLRSRTDLTAAERAVVTRKRKPRHD